MDTLGDILQFISYGTALDIAEVGNTSINHLFSADELVTREVIERNHVDLLYRELHGGIHAEGPRQGTLFIPIELE